ncbi:hypothetical protein [Streptomyces cyaneofuscatus]
MADTDAARYNLLAAISFNDAANAGSTPEELVDAYQAEVLHRAADEYERNQAAQYPGAIYGAIRRIRSFKVGAYLRAMANDATEGSR